MRIQRGQLLRKEVTLKVDPAHKKYKEMSSRRGAVVNESD